MKFMFPKLNIDYKKAEDNFCLLKNSVPVKVVGSGRYAAKRTIMGQKFLSIEDFFTVSISSWYSLERDACSHLDPSIFTYLKEDISQKYYKIE